MGDTDRDLVARVRAGDDAAFAVLYERYRRRIAAYVFGMVKDHGRAEDITQDVFMSALRRMRDTDREIAFKPWVYEIAKNASIDQFRRSRRAEEVSYDADEAVGGADHRRLVSASPTPDAAVAQKLALDDLRGAFGGLSELHHQILVMREFEGLSYHEIGARLGMTRPAVESTLFRARRRLAEEYEELVSGARCVRVQGIVARAETGSLGARDRRKLAAHVSHCQPCRRHALLAGIDPALLRARPRVRAKIAALLPLPAFLRPRLHESEAAVSQHSAHVAQWSTQLSTFADPAVTGWSRAVAAVMTIAVAGVGAGVARQDHHASNPAKLSQPSAVSSASHVRTAAKAPHRAARPSTHRTASAVTRPAAARRTTARSDLRSQRRTSVAKSNAAGRAQSSAPAAPAQEPAAKLANTILSAAPELPAANVDTTRPRGLISRTLAGVVSNGRRTTERPVSALVHAATSTVDDARGTVQRLIPGG